MTSLGKKKNENEEEDIWSEDGSCGDGDLFRTMSNVTRRKCQVSWVPVLAEYSLRPHDFHFDQHPKKTNVSLSYTFDPFLQLSYQFSLWYLLRGSKTLRPHSTDEERLYQSIIHERSSYNVSFCTRFHKFDSIFQGQLKKRKRSMFNLFLLQRPNVISFDSHEAKRLRHCSSLI